MKVAKLQRIFPPQDVPALSSLWFATKIVTSAVGALQCVLRNQEWSEVYFDDFCVTRTGIRMGMPRVLAGEAIPSDSILVVLEDGRFFFFRKEDLNRLELLEIEKQKKEGP